MNSLSGDCSVIVPTFLLEKRQLSTEYVLFFRGSRTDKLPLTYNPLLSSIIQVGCPFAKGKKEKKPDNATIMDGLLTIGAFALATLIETLFVLKHAPISGSPGQQALAVALAAAVAYIATWVLYYAIIYPRFISELRHVPTAKVRFSLEQVEQGFQALV